MAVSMEEIKSGIQEIGKSHNELTQLVTKYKGDTEVLINETIQKCANDVALKHEVLQRELDSLKASAEARSIVSDPDETKLRVKTANFFAKMRQDVQQESFKNGNMHQFPDFEPTSTDPQKYSKVFWKAVRTSNTGDRGISIHALNEMERKDMAVGSDPDGGYFLAPPTIAQAVVQRVFETSPMRELSSSINIGTREYVVPEDPSDVGVGWVGERQARTPTQTVVPSRKIIPAMEEYAEPAITQQLLEDAMFDLETYLINKLADKFVRNENSAFVNGSGINQPRGFMTYNTINVNEADWYYWGNALEQINSGTAGTFTYTGLVKLITSLKENFQQNACFLIKRQSVWGVMTITDSNGRLIFQPILNGNFNNTPLLGYPLRYATDMPNLQNSFGSPITAVNAMAFGDFRQGYQIVDRVGLSMIRDNITSKGNVLLYTRKRCGGDVVNFDAIKIHSLQ